MAENKTKPTQASVDEFFATLANPQQREDSQRLRQLMTEVTGEPAVMWGPSIVGFGLYHYRSARGRTGDTFTIGFSPRKQALTLYLNVYLEQVPGLLDGLGTYTLGKGCLYLKRLDDAAPDAL